MGNEMRRRFEKRRPQISLFFLLSLDAAGAVAFHQRLDLVDGDIVEVRLDGMLETGGRHGEFDGFLIVVAVHEAVDKSLSLIHI